MNLVTKNLQQFWSRSVCSSSWMNIMVVVFKSSDPLPYHCLTLKILSIHFRQLSMNVKQFHAYSTEKTDNSLLFTFSRILILQRHFKLCTMQCKNDLLMPQWPLLTDAGMHFSEFFSTKRYRWEGKSRCLVLFTYQEMNQSYKIW